MTRTVYINPGHGGKDPGCSGGGLQEKNIVLEVSTEIIRILKGAGVNVLTNRTTDVFWELKDITDDANRRAKSSDLFVSVHVNAGGGRGAAVWHSIGRKPNFAAAVVKNLVEDVGFSVYGSTGTHTRTGSNGKDYYHVIRQANMESVIVELGFIDNPVDFAILRQPAKRKAMAKAVADAILSYIGVKGSSPAPAPAPAPAPTATPAENMALVKALVAKKVVSDSKIWADVLDGKKAANPKWVRLIFDRADALGVKYDAAYWDGYFAGKTELNVSFLRAIFVRIANS